MNADIDGIFQALSWLTETSPVPNWLFAYVIIWCLVRMWIGRGK